MNNNQYTYNPPIAQRPLTYSVASSKLECNVPLPSSLTQYERFRHDTKSF